MLFDTHMHTCFSTDSKMTMDEAVARGKELGIGITITEHMDIAYPEPLAFIFDVDEYFAKYNQYCSDSVLLGIEIGMRGDCLVENCSLVEKYDFDYVIGSIHILDNIDIYDADFYRGKTKQDVYRQYFQTMLECITCYDGIHSLGHIDYIARYAKFADPAVHYSEFKEQIDEVLIMLARKGKALEINTRRLDSKESVDIILPIFKRFQEVGGQMVTIGSDAHRVNEIGRGLTIGVEIAERSKLQVVYFKNGQPQYIK